MTWALQLTVWWMNFATLLATWMLRFGTLAYRVDLRRASVRILSRQGSIVRTSPAVIPSLWPPLVIQLTSTAKHSTTWLLLANTKPMWVPRGWSGKENGEGAQMWCTLSFQEPARGPLP